MSLFQARREDGRAEWKVIFDHVLQLGYGDELSYGTIAGLLGTDDRQRAYRAVRECNRHLRGEDSQVARYLGSARGSGYRVLHPGDYSHAALAQRDSAARRITSAVDIMRSAPLDDMTPAQRHWANQVTLHLVDHEVRLMGIEARAGYAEQRIAELERRAGIRHPADSPGEAEHAEQQP